MPYTVLRGEFVIRYPDVPRQGPEPDGDTIKFAPDTPALVERLPRISGQAPDLSARGISVRLEAIDALETHFGDVHQELAGANAGRDALLAALGFTNVVFFPDLPNKVQSADADRLRGCVLSNGIDANGRMIGFVYPGDPADADGASVFVDSDLVGTSVNAHLLAAGHAYPAFYGTLPAELRDHLAGLSVAARTSNPPAGVWARATGDPGGPATVTDLASLQTLVLWPKLFRRLVPYFAVGNTTLDDFDAFLRADPVNRDDTLFLLDRLEPGNMHDVVEGSGDQIRLSVFPERFIIEPDPATGGGVPRPRVPLAADVVIIATLPDPVGSDAGRESVTLLNTTAASVDLTGWSLLDGSAVRESLTGTLAAGETRLVRLSALQLGNRGETLVLADSGGCVIDQVAYRANQVGPGRTVALGR